MENGQSATVITLMITFDRATGEIQVNGPVQDKLFCMGILECAKDAVRDYKLPKEQSNILKFSGILPKMTS